jgi:adenylate kinase family enzyme
MQRILVIGSPGAGKSTLAAELARRTGLPLIHLDQHAWLPGWVELDRELWNAKVQELIARDEWIIDGNYGGTLPLRLTRADTVIDLELPAWLCVARLLRRIFGGWGRVRADMAEGCPEQLDLAFLLYTVRFSWTHRRRIAEKLKVFPGAVIRLQSSRDVRRFLATLDQRG